jgi:sugar-phosphatase
MNMFVCQAVLFDLDGVLVDSKISVERIWRKWTLKHGIDYDRLIAIAHGRRSIETIREIAPHLDAVAEAQRVDLAEANDPEGIVAVPGALELLNTLPADRWAVVTSGERVLAEARLRFAGLPFPPLMISGDLVTQGKPHPEGYLKAAERLSIAPEQCVVIEDAPIGIRAARAAGMSAIALSTTFTPEHLQEADICIPSLEAVAFTPAADGSFTLAIADEMMPSFAE